jgi:hypothetical protein
MEHHTLLYNHENTWNKCGGVLNSEVAMLGVGDKILLKKKKQNVNHMILWSHIEELFLTFIFLIPKKKKKLLVKVWSFRRVKKKNLHWFR